MATIRPIAEQDIHRAPRQLEGLLDAAAQAGSRGSVLLGWYDQADTLVHAALALPQPGRTAMIFATQPRRRKTLTQLATLIDRTCEQLTAEQATLAQALIDPHDDLLRDALTEAGFSELAVLCYLQRRVGSRQAEPDVPENVQLRTWDESLRDDFLTVLADSYNQTLDCPALQGLRRTEDVLDGHRGAGEFAPELWTLLYVDDQPAGALLMNPVPITDCVELVYLGLSPDYRGRGYGALLMQRALRQCAQRGETYLTLAVDASNTPAMALYQRFKLRRTMRKRAMIKNLIECK